MASSARSARDGMRRESNDKADGNPYSILQPSANSVDSSVSFQPIGSNEYIDKGEVRERVKRYGKHSSRKKMTSAARLGFDAHAWVSEDWKDKVTKSVASMDTKSLYNASLDQEEIEEIKKMINVSKLQTVGCTQEIINMMVYNHLDKHKLPNFLCSLHLDGDGGLDRITSLWNNQKILWAFILFAFVILNVWYLLASNWIVFHGFLNHVVEEQTGLVKTTLEDAMHGKLDVTNLTFDASHLNNGMNDFSQAASHSGNFTGENDIFSHIPDPNRRDLILKMAGVAGTCEVLWVLVFILYIIYEIGFFLCSKSEYTAFTSILHVFQDHLPLLSTFSLMKFMSSVHPALVYNMYLDHINNTVHSTSRFGPIGVKISFGMQVLYFILTRFVLASLALFAFSMKLLSVGLKLIDPNYGFGACLITAFGFMNQCMGCVLFERVLQERIFLFIFGGSDTDFCEDELALKAVYRCRMAKQIWEDFWMKGEKFKTIVMYATLDHYDLQRLLINEPEEHEVRSSSQHQNSRNVSRDDMRARLASAASSAASDQTRESRNASREESIEDGQGVKVIPE